MFKERRCEICGKSEEYEHLDPHHTIKQSRGGTDDDIVWLCRVHHNWVETHPSEARAIGLDIKKYKLNNKIYGQ